MWCSYKYLNAGLNAIRGFSVCDITTDDDPFHDCKLAPDAILWAHTFEDVLFTDGTETPVNVRTGKHQHVRKWPSKRPRSSRRVSTPIHHRPRFRHRLRRKSRPRASPTRRPRSSTSRRPAPARTDRRSTSATPPPKR
ncbi:hypothetical protein C487_19683 [Natrinema pallidum DSM 3751]|uniref:Uncharacterized protein n=1 Tax=Natrinema pallidum DSM 3751 TaxID=1227495 RepID=L9YGM3_9EURY|nr:hypothetical protein C487_19683 [Natrinema pallidum DSM 3751]